MGLMSAMGQAFKLVIGGGLGFILILMGLISAGFIEGTMGGVLALVLFIVGIGFLIWAKGG